MGNYSRDTFRLTNVMHQLTSGESVVNPRHFTSVKLQQGVPVLDSDWNELDDIRKAELGLILARAIGSGVPSGSDGFRIGDAGTVNDFTIDAGIIFIDGWVVYNRNKVAYSNQPFRNAEGVAPVLPVLQNAPSPEKDLVYLDAWEEEIDGEEDTDLVNDKIGVETCTRLMRVWVVRMEKIASDADPLDSATIPNRQTGHRYYSLATVDRPAGGQISAGMITDLRRTHLTLEKVTHAPLLIDDVVRDQRLDSSRFAAAFRGNIEAMQDLLGLFPETFVFLMHLNETFQAMTAFQDTRSSAVCIEQQAMAGVFSRQTALPAIGSFYKTFKYLIDTLQGFVDDGIASQKTEDFITTCKKHLDGTTTDDPMSMSFALEADDLLGAVMALERMNEELGLTSDTLPEGTVSANLITITPVGPVMDKTVQPKYQLTIRIKSNLSSAQGSEPIRAIVSAGAGWTLAFEGSTQPDKKETLVTIDNGQSKDVILDISAEPGATDSPMNLTVRPERRQQLVYTHPPVALALGQEIIPGDVLASLSYQGGIALQPGNALEVGRHRMTSPVVIPFEIALLSATHEDFKVTVTPQGAATGWKTPNEPTLSMDPGDAPRIVNITFQSTDELGAVSPLTYRVQLLKTTGGASDALIYTSFDLTFKLS